MREMRVGNLKTKIGECQQECSALVGKSSSPYLTPQEKIEIAQLQTQTIEQCHNLRHMLSLYEQESQGDGNAS
jgi:hypothetical protein